MTNKILAPLTLTLFIIFGVYIGAASLVSTKNVHDYNEAKTIKQLSKNLDTINVIYDGLIFENQQELDHFINDVKYAKVSRFFDWSESMPDFLILILGACSFGMLGSILKILTEHVFLVKRLPVSDYIALPALGFLSGFISIGISYLLPNIFLDAKALINPVGLILFSLFFGFFIKEFLEKISNQLFKTKNKE